MTISELFDYKVFMNTGVKLIIAMNDIESIIGSFVDKTNYTDDAYEPCSMCTPTEKCKKHKALDRVLSCTRAVKVTGFDLPDGIDGLFLSKSDMFVYNANYNSILIIDCPPLYYMEGTQLHDFWVRKVIPFTLSNVDFDISTIDIEKEIDVSEIKRVNRISCSIGHQSNNGYYTLELKKKFSGYVWALKSN